MKENYYIDRDYFGNLLENNALYIVVNNKDALQLNKYLDIYPIKEDSNPIINNKELLCKYIFFNYRKEYDLSHPNSLKNVIKLLKDNNIQFEYHYTKYNVTRINNDSLINENHGQNLLNNIINKNNRLIVNSSLRDML